MPRFLQIIVAVGGASYAWRWYSALYERHRAASQSSDAVGDKWWRVMSHAVAIVLLTFCLTVTAGVLRAPRWVAILLVVLLVASLLIAFVGAAAVRRRAARTTS
jgi:hypothetical protein